MNLLVKWLLDNLLSGYKTYLAGLGLIGLAIFQLSNGDFTTAFQSFLAGLAALGIRHALDKDGQTAK